MTKYGPSNIKGAWNLFLVTGNGDGINSSVSKQVCLMVICLRMDRLSCQASPNSIAASFLLSGGLEQETPLFSLFLAARVCAWVSLVWEEYRTLATLCNCHRHRWRLERNMGSPLWAALILPSVGSQVVSFISCLTEPVQPSAVQ